MALQTSLSKIFNNLKSGVFTRYADNTDKFLLDTAAIGWMLASLSNMTGVFFNKKVDKKERRYLAAQEIADGVTNVALFYGITYSLIKGARGLVDKGIIGSKALDEKGTMMLKNGVGTIASLFGAVFTNNLITPVVRNKFATFVQKKTGKNDVYAQSPIVKPSSIPYTPIQQKTPISIQSYMAFTKNGGNMRI